MEKYFFDFQFLQNLIIALLSSLTVAFFIPKFFEIQKSKMRLFNLLVEISQNIVRLQRYKDKGVTNELDLSVKTKLTSKNQYDLS